eukprot:8536072-Lingulodinium_polyedra.AAC.1
MPKNPRTAQFLEPNNVWGYALKTLGVAATLINAACNALSGNAFLRWLRRRPAFNWYRGMNNATFRQRRRIAPASVAAPCLRNGRARNAPTAAQTPLRPLA